MRKSVCLVLLTTMAAVVALSGCSGSKVSSSWPIDPQEVRALFPGATALDATPVQIRDGIAEVMAKADTLVLSDVHILDEAAPDHLRFETTCSKDICRSTLPGSGRTVENSLDALGVTDSIFEPVMLYNGVRIVLEDLPAVPASDNYGGWLHYSHFSAQLNFRNAVGRIAFSLGVAPNAALQGDATWSGAMTGVDLTIATGSDDFVQGKADVSFSFSEQTVDVTFSEILDLTTGNSVADITWTDVPVVDNGFTNGGSDRADRIDGRFYGPNHEEVGGVFEKGRILGAFGAFKQ